MLGMLQEFDPGRDLGRIEEVYPLIAHAYLMRPDGQILFADDPSTDHGVASQAADVGQDPLWIESLLRLDQPTAAGILSQTLDSATIERLMQSHETGFFRGQHYGEPYHLTAFGFSDQTGQYQGVAGFFLNLQHVREKFLAQVLEEAIKTAEGRFSPNFGRYITFLVSDHYDELVYVHKRPGATVSPDKWEFISEAELWDVLPGWHVKLVYTDPKGATHRRGVWLANSLTLAIMAVVALVGVLLSIRFGLRQMELSNMKSHFVSNITHELKTPLSAIRLYVETLLEKRVKDEEQERRFLGIINKESVRLTHLINNILDFSRIEMGRKRYDFEPTQVDRVVREVVDGYSYQLRDKGFEIDLDVQEGLPRLVADGDALSQALLNLIDNAVKYSQESTQKSVEVRVRRLKPAVGPLEVQIDVRDHGVGIPASEHKRIFEEFYRVEKGLEHDVKGSGLGLAVVKHIIDAHGGTIEVKSHRGDGTTFRIRLPVQETT
jgi:signal transduction histidine kinase